MILRKMLSELELVRKAVEELHRQCVSGPEEPEHTQEGRLSDGEMQAAIAAVMSYDGKRREER